VKNIRQLMCLNWDVSEAHAFRESNYCANALANYGCSMESSIWFLDTCHSQPRQLLLVDVMGVTTPQIIFMQSSYFLGFKPSILSKIK
jgi:hypothetical protein